ncbi:telomere-associated protein RIF1 isoform X2 [Nothobranchius furzeri]|uniref:Transcript variant X2 n=1 Tax=Nothobranchius furzeri TaxID=105023 RepID=A0A9D2Y6P3_NOTFU|nr:telomere-associated protein RIF1 isoform X3 [Nothobranchius furzeri]KAF7215219.1 transcript variant X2 [Nothobranchius furzeri]
MMATAGPSTFSSFLPLLEILEDSSAGQSEQTDAYLTIAIRLGGEEGRQFLPTVEKNFSRLCKVLLDHMTSPNAELSQAALQALGFCVYHSHVVAGVSETFAAQILSALCSLVTKSTDKNTCTRALWVISKQNFPADVVAKHVSSVLSSLESVWSREDLQSVVMEHEALNVIIRMLDQVPTQMGDRAVQWVKLVVPLVVHSASKVRLRAASALEMGMPLLLAKQTEVAAVIEPMMCSKLIPELQKLFTSKNETNVLKLWSLFVKLLGKLLHRGGPFINALLYLEELGFRSSSPTIKKIAFIAWKSLIDNFALNPDILCSAKRMKLLMQPLLSIQVRTEALLLTKVEVWWYLVVQLGPNLSSNFDQVSAPLLQSTIGSDPSAVPGTPSRAAAQNGAIVPSTPKSAGSSSFNSPARSPWFSLNSSMQSSTNFSSIQLLGLEMLLHYFLGPEVIAVAAKNKLVLSLEPLHHPLLTGASSFMKHAAVLVSSIKDGFINSGKEAPEPLLAVIWTSLVRFVSMAIETGSKKDRQGCEVLTLMLQALQNIVASRALPADKVLVLFEATVTGIPQKVLGSPSYQVGKMDVLNGTPSLFLILLLLDSHLLPTVIEDEKFFRCLQLLVSCGLSGPTSPLAFTETVLGAIGHSAGSLQNKEQLWRLWAVIVGPLTDSITQSNEVNQGDALEHNFSTVHSALMFPVQHLLCGPPLPQAAQRSMLSSWAKLYKVFARCSALVATAEENVCCEEFCSKMAAVVDREVLAVPAALSAVASILHVMVECVDFSPYTPHFQQKLKSPHTPVNWVRKQSKALRNLSTFLTLLVECLQVYLHSPDPSSEPTGLALVSILSALFTNLVLTNAVQETLSLLMETLVLFYKQAASEPPKFTPRVLEKLEKLLGEVLSCLQTRAALAFSDELLALLSPLLCVLFPHKNKHLRLLVTQFWNATFASCLSLTYPEEIRPVLSQVKQKTPIILPGFEAVGVPEELSGSYSSENSQMETKLSGVPISSTRKRDSLLGKAAEQESQISTRTSKSVSTKLDFGSPKPPHRPSLLEEEDSVDFVFIPPETKERVLTEHQKEMKRTKRVDIPAMYNNLDASQDTSVFTRYTQSQEDSDNSVVAEPESSTAKEEVPHKDQQMNDALTKETQDDASPTTGGAMEIQLQEDIIPDSSHTPGGGGGVDDGDADDKASPNTSASSDLVSGTPQKSSSRRQSFITLEKYGEGKPASPSSVSSFTGPLVKTSSSPDHSSTTNTLASEAPQDSAHIESSPQVLLGESPQRPKDSRTESEPVRLQRDSAEDEDVIPDTQAEGQDGTTPMEEPEPSIQEHTPSPEASHSPSEEPRRSGRHRVRPQLPGEDPVEREAKVKPKESGEDLKKESPKISPRGPNTRSRQVAEENSPRDRLRSRTLRTSGELSQPSSLGRPRKKIRLYSNSADFLDYPEHKRSLESNQSDVQSETLSRFEGRKRRGRPSKSPKETEVKKVRGGSGQAVVEDSVEFSNKQDGGPETDMKIQLVERTATESGAQEDTATDQSLDRTPNTSVSEEMIKDEPQTEDSVGEDLSQEDSQVMSQEDSQVMSQDDSQVMSQDDSQVTPSSLSGQSKRRSRRVKSSEAADSGNKGDSDVSVRQLRSWQSSTPTSHAKGKTRRRKMLEFSPGFVASRRQSSQSSESESSQSRARYSKKRSLPAPEASSESSPLQENSPVLLKKSRKPRASLQNPPTPELKEEEAALEQVCVSLSSEAKVEELQTPDLRESQQTEENVEELMEEETAQKEPETEDLKQSSTSAGDDVGAPSQEVDMREHEDAVPPDETPADLSEVTSENLMEESVHHKPAGVEPVQDDQTQGQEEQSSEHTSDAHTEEDRDSGAETGRLDSDTSGSSEGGVRGIKNSPSKQKDQETGADSSPSNGQGRVTWSPSASPSTSILKKGQRRSLVEEVTSPLVKSRRVSFANPIQQQETADDIDRRSPAVRTSSPRRSRVSGIPQLKQITTPTKGVVVLSPRTLHSPGYRSSKKSLISELSQEPRAVPSDCIYPALVGCSAPVEAVLPHLSSTMWSRGFGQLVRSRNIKTVGDLSALTPTDIKTLPIRSPKISNVKKALKIYEQQRKGRGGDELKSFDEMEMMTSELEETSAPENQNEVEEASGETGATEVTDKSSADEDATAAPDGPAGGQRPEEAVHPDRLVSAVEALTCRMTPLELSCCTPQQLVEMHEQLGGMMRSVVVELQTRLDHSDGAH